MSLSDWPALRRVFRLPATAGRVRRDVDDELRFHLEGRVEELVTGGMTRAEAEAEARRRFGDYDEHRRHTRAIDEETVRMRHRTEYVDALRRETEHAIRSLLRTPAFTVMTLLTLSLGIGAATAIYAVLDAVVLRALPYANADRLVKLYSPVPGVKSNPRWWLARHEMFYFKQAARTIEDIGVYRTVTLTVMGDGSSHPAERARGALVSASMFDVLGIRPLAGRLLTAADNREEKFRVAVLGHDYWQRRFGGDRSVLGRTIQIEGFPVEVVGIAPGGAQLPDLATDLWLPQHVDPAAPPTNNHVFQAIARLRPGVTASDANSELSALTARFPETFPGVYSRDFMRNTGFTTLVVPLRDDVIGDFIARALWMLFGAVSLVLLVAAANVANLFLVRTDARRREVAVRTALGADRSHLAWHYLTESLVLSLVAAAAAVGLAYAGLRTLLAMAPPEIPRLAEVHIGWTSVVFAVGCALLAGLVFGLLPLTQAGVDVLVLREGGRGLTSSRQRNGVRAILVVGQVALALVLLSGAGLLVRSFNKLRNVRAGFDPAGVTTMTISLPVARYQKPEQISAFFQRLAERVRELPGVQGVGFTDFLPLGGNVGCTGVLGERQSNGARPGACVMTARVSPGYFEAMRIPVQGRTATWTETSAYTAGAVVSPALAEQFWPGETAIDKGIRCCNGGPPYMRVIGVTGDVRTQGLDQPALEVVYFPLIDTPGVRNEGTTQFMNLVARSTGSLDALTTAIRSIVTEMDTQVPIANIQSMETVVAKSMARRTFTMMLLGIAAALALLLSVIGIYGVISYVVTQRRSEIGIRVALGARGAQVSGMVVSQSLRLAAIGVAIGLVGAFAATRFLRALLFEVSPTDPLVLGGVSVLLLLLSALASYAPARRAARVDPVESLRAG